MNKGLHEAMLTVDMIRALPRRPPIDIFNSISHLQNIDLPLTPIPIVLQKGSRGASVKVIVAQSTLQCIVNPQVSGVKYGTEGQRTHVGSQRTILVYNVRQKHYDKWHKLKYAMKISSPSAALLGISIQDT